MGRGDAKLLVHTVSSWIIIRKSGGTFRILEKTNCSYLKKQTRSECFKIKRFNRVLTKETFFFSFRLMQKMRSQSISPFLLSTRYSLQSNPWSNDISLYSFTHTHIISFQIQTLRTLCAMWYYRLLSSRPWQIESYNYIHNIFSQVNVQQRIQSDGTDSSSSSAEASSDSSDSSSSDASSATGLGSKTYTVDYTGYKTALFNDIFNVSGAKPLYTQMKNAQLVLLLYLPTFRSQSTHCAQ